MPNVIEFLNSLQLYTFAKDNPELNFRGVFAGPQTVKRNDKVRNWALNNFLHFCSSSCYPIWIHGFLHYAAWNSNQDCDTIIGITGRCCLLYRLGAVHRGCCLTQFFLMHVVPFLGALNTFRFPYAVERFTRFLKLFNKNFQSHISTIVIHKEISNRYTQNVHFQLSLPLFPI